MVGKKQWHICSQRQSLPEKKVVVLVPLITILLLSRLQINDKLSPLCRRQCTILSPFYCPNRLLAIIHQTFFFVYNNNSTLPLVYETLPNFNRRRV